MIERLKRYVAIRSLSREEAALADCVQGELEAAGLAVRRSGNNLWCETGDAERPRLLLNSHLDTVPAADGWTGDPWMVREVDGRIVGLGANDAKGCAVAMIEAFLAIHRRLNSVASAASRSSGQKGRSETGPPKGLEKDRSETGPPKALGGTVVLALTAEEEISGAGLSTIRESLEPIDAAIVGEPTGLTPMIAQRGLLILRGAARGRTGHPANTPADTADNAIVNAAREITRLREFDWGPEHPLLGRCHAHVTQIAGGVARNVMPDACEFYIDIRTTPAESHDALYERLRQFLRCELHVHSKRLVPVETSANEPIVQAAAGATDRRPAGSPTMSDMVFLSGVPGVKMGPGESARSHTPDEFVTREELSAGVAAYERIVCEYFDSVRTGDGRGERTKDEARNSKPVRP
jgi:acetylornithine deacetylase